MWVGGSAHTLTATNPHKHKNIQMHTPTHTTQPPTPHMPHICALNIHPTHYNSPPRPQGHDHNVSDVAFLPSGDALLSCSRDATIRLWDAHSGALRRTFTGHQEWVRYVPPPASASAPGLPLPSSPAKCPPHLSPHVPRAYTDGPFSKWTTPQGLIKVPNESHIGPTLMDM